VEAWKVPEIRRQGLTQNSTAKHISKEKWVLFTWFLYSPGRSHQQRFWQILYQQWNLEEETSWWEVQPGGALKHEIVVYLSSSTKFSEGWKLPSNVHWDDRHDCLCGLTVPDVSSHCYYALTREKEQCHSIVYPKEKAECHSVVDPKEKNESDVMVQTQLHKKLTTSLQIFVKRILLFTCSVVSL
jgi:hypothetical protein